MKHRAYIRFCLLFLLCAALAHTEENLNEQLLEAARTGNLQRVQELLNKGADIQTKNKYGTTPLFFAAAKGHLEVARFLLEKGADPNQKDTFYGSTAIEWAAQEGHFDVVKLLLQKGANGADD